jgi:xylan 1,4-beta-xylosidase
LTADLKQLTTASLEQLKMMKQIGRLGGWLALATCFCGIMRAEGQPVQVRVALTEKLGPMHMQRMALGQGGLSEEPIFAGRESEIRALRPGLIRLFVQEYYDLLPERGRYHFDTLDRMVDSILRTGAKPLMCICFKPRVLFPEINDTIVEPKDYAAWEELVFNVVKHYRDRGAGIHYWEIGNEVDIGEDGGTPYRFQPESYVRYYQHTAAAILRAHPEARVGGPALASVQSPILPALLDACAKKRTPLHFVSWHLYSSSPAAIRGTVDYAHGMLKKHPELTPETFLDEWNMDLMNPPLDPRYQPCFVAETIWQMKEAGLDWSCYYHVRDYYVSYDTFSRYFSANGTAFMTRWWNRQPQFDGLFDYQNQIRPAYFTFKLLSRMAGERLRVSSTSDKVHGFAAHDPQLQMNNVMLWNFSGKPVQVELKLEALPKEMRTRHIILDAVGAGVEENQRLRPEPLQALKAGCQKLSLKLEPWAIHYWSLE